MNRNILNLRQLTVLLILCTAFLGGIIPAFAQQGGKKITGQVIDENKEPMIGVSILIVGTSTGTVTDFDGNYTLNVPQGNKELQFSYVGYETKIVALPTSGSVLNVQMKSDSQVLSDVVVIGYGTQRKRSPFLGSDKDYSVGCTRTVDSGGRSIFQNGHTFNVVRVDEAQKVSVVPADTTLFQRNTVQNNQRVVAGIQ